jgi:asparagine synthase (glutamine-hydrolysing)
MPGIVGLITKMPRERAARELSQMVKALCHETFYETGTKIDESLGVYVGWVTRAKQFPEEMPYSSERGDIDLVFSGEEYPESGIASRLRERGHSLNSDDRSYLVHLYEEDQNFLRGLNGMFHGLLMDRTRGAVLLFNDRFGMHRLYYHETKDAFYFAAEAKAILAIHGELRKADPKGLGEFVALGCTLENRTIFQDIHVLPAGSTWVFQNASLRQRCTYFEPREWEEQPSLDAETYYQELKTVLARNLPRYFAGREALGMTLTGGLDTRVVMAWQKHAPHSIPCYTYGSMFRDCQDVKVARRVASLSEQSHQVIPLGNEFLNRFSSYAERTIYMTEGGVDVYRTCDLYASEKAREIAPAKIVGTYGSEIVHHDVMFKPGRLLPGLFTAEFTPYIAEAGTTYTHIRRQHPVTFAAFRQSPWYHHGVVSLERTQLAVHSPFLDNDFVRTVFRAPQMDDRSSDVRLRLISDGNSALGRIPSDRGVGGPAGLSSTIARNLLEFSFKAEYAYDYGMPQWLAKIDHAFAPLHFERLFLGRHKFSHFRLWYRDSLSQYVRQILLDRKTLARPYLDRRRVEALVEGHTKGTGNYTPEIHKLLTLELLQRLFLDSQ